MLPDMSNKKKDSIRHFFDHQVLKYAEFPPLVPPVMAKKFKGQRKLAGGFMVAKHRNKDIVCPMLRPDMRKRDMKTYKSVVAKLGYNPSLEDLESYMQFMNYNQIAYLELLPQSSAAADKGVAESSRKQ